MQAEADIAKKHLTELLAQHETASELLLVIDQFEELFTLSDADNDAACIYANVYDRKSESILKGGYTIPWNTVGIC